MNISQKVSRRSFCALTASAPFVNVLKSYSSEYPYEFKPYRPDQTLCPIHKVTPEDGVYIHTFFDRSPISPDGQYLVCLRMPFQDRMPKPGEKAEVCLIDLKKQKIETLYATDGWEPQTAAHQQWGPSGKYIYFGDVEDHRPVTVRFDIKNRSYDIFDGPLYQISPDERYAASVDLAMIGQTQGGYGVIVKDQYIKEMQPGASPNEGLWVTDLKTGKKKLLVSMAQCYELLPNKDQYKGGTFFGFHVKYNRQGTRMMLVVRNRPPEGGYEPSLVTFKPDGSDLKLALANEVWGLGGHHPDWHPNGTHITHNLHIGEKMRFCQFKYDGSDFELLSHKLVGGGHPSFHVDGRYMVSDAYIHEDFTTEDYEVPIRWLDMKNETEKYLCTIFTFKEHKGVLRCDPHPAWSFDFNKISFNGVDQGKKSIYVADVSDLV